MKVALLVHRWFAHGGAGWAYHPGLQPSLMACRLALKDELHGDLGSVGPFEVPGAGLVLVGVRTADPDRATDDYGRPLAVLRAAALPGRPDEAAREELCRLLHDRPVPDHPGADAALEFDWAGSVTPLPRPAAPARAPTRRRGRALVWAAAGVLCGVALVALVLSRLPTPGQAPPASAPALAHPEKKDTAPAAPNGPDLAERERKFGQLLGDVGGVQKLPELEGLLEKYDARQFPPKKVAEISMTVRNRCRGYFLEQARRNDSGGKDVREVEQGVKSAGELLDAVPRLQASLGPGMNAEETEEWDRFREEVGDAIDRLCYSRVCSCREQLAQRLNDNSDRWRESLDALDASLKWYRRTKAAPKKLQNTLSELRGWCDRIMAETPYEFTVCGLPDGWLLFDTLKYPHKRLNDGENPDVKLPVRTVQIDQSQKPTFSLNAAVVPPRSIHSLDPDEQPLTFRLTTEESEIPPRMSSIRVKCPELRLPRCPEFPERSGRGGSASGPPPGGARATDPPPAPKKATTDDVLKEIDDHLGTGKGKSPR